MEVTIDVLFEYTMVLLGLATLLVMWFNRKK